MVKARTLWPGVESPPAPTGQGAEHPVYPCQSNCISSPDCHLLNDPSNNSELLRKGQEMGVIVIDEPNNQVTYRLGKESKYPWSDPEGASQGTDYLRSCIHL